MSGIRLIVNADDFARSPGVTGGILKAHQNGLVSTTTAMMNLKDARPAVVQAQAAAPDLAIGVHLNITFGKPLSSPEKVASLIDGTGSFHSFRDLIANPDKLELREVEREWRNQIEALLDANIQLDHLDSHHHSAVFSEALFLLLLDLAGEYDCGVRNPNPSDIDSSSLNSLYPEGITGFIQQAAEPLMRARAVPHPEHFLASFFGDTATKDHLSMLLRRLSPGTYELMCHPGFADDELALTSSYDDQREKELEVLTDDEIKSLTQELNIHPATFQSLRTS